jgi:glycolate oxidase FAD binding subunit
VLSAKAGTPLAEVEALVAASGQELAFRADGLWAPCSAMPQPAARSAGHLPPISPGPRRIKAGAARDHFLGVSAVSGRGETFKSGGRVVKNVTGYDLCKLLAAPGAPLAAMTEVTIKTLPRAETEETVLVLKLDDAAAGKGHGCGLGLLRRCVGGGAFAGCRRRAHRRDRLGACRRDRLPP